MGKLFIGRPLVRVLHFLLAAIGVGKMRPTAQNPKHEEDFRKYSFLESAV